MKLIGTTDGGYIAELTQLEATRLTNQQQPVLNTEYQPLKMINKARWVVREMEKLAAAETDLRAVSDRVAALRASAEKEQE